MDYKVIDLNDYYRKALFYKTLEKEIAQLTAQ